MKKLSLSPYYLPMRAPKKAARKRPRANPRVPCKTVSSKRNKYVGGLISLQGKWAGKQRKVVGCAVVKGSDKAFYATRVVGKLGTRYVPISKAAIRGLHHRDPARVSLVKHSGVTKTSEKLIAVWEKRYAKAKKAKKAPAKKAPRANPMKRSPLRGAAKAEFLARMAAGKRRAARG